MLITGKKIDVSMCIRFLKNIGVIDSSGIRFHYSSIPREHNAGILAVGHFVTPYMVIPPGAPNYTIGAVCTGSCTKQVSKKLMK